MKWPNVSFPTSTSVVFATVSWMFTSWREEEERYLQNYRQKVQMRLQHLYGPLHGNRMIYRANLQSIERKYHSERRPDLDYLKSIEEHLELVCAQRNEPDLEDWRGFYRRNLKKLDDKALEIIQKYCHLIETDESKLIMREYIEEVSDRSLNMERWMDGDKFDQCGKFEETDFNATVNNTNFAKADNLDKHVELCYDDLLAKRRELDEQLRAHQSSSLSVDSFLKNLGKK